MRTFPEYHGPMVGWPRVQAIPGAAEVLEILYPGWQLALATNAADSDEPQIRAALERVGLERWIERIYCYRFVRQLKPHPNFYSTILEDLELPASRVFMVGDDFQADVLGANQVGIRAVWFNEDGLRPDRMGEMYRTIHHLYQLPMVLDDLTS